MKITLKNYTEILPADILKKGGQDKVRECDEVEKGRFQAYIDEKEETFDTSIRIGNQGDITEHNCDCNVLTYFCRHKAALLLFVVQGKKITQKAISKKKVDPLEKLVLDTDPDKIKIWLLDLFTKNKDLGLAFTHHFSFENIQNEPAKIKQLTLDAVKAVVNKRKNIEIGEVKKIVDLWSGIHQSIITAYIAQPADKKTFMRMDAVLDACEEARYKLNTSSARFKIYRDSILEKVLIPLNQIKDDQYWNQSVDLLAAQVVAQKYLVRTYYLDFLVKLFELSSLERRKSMAFVLMSQYLKINPAHYQNGERYTISLFHMISSTGLFNDYYAFFLPIHYSNDYNISLISQLMQHDMLNLAEKYCLQQIDANSNGEYDSLYLQFLFEIYSTLEDNVKLAWVLRQLLPLTFDITAYVFIFTQTEDKEEMKIFRNTILAKARRAASYDYAAMAFSFLMMQFEEDYNKMINYVDSSATYGIIVRFADQMAVGNREAFLKQMLNRTDNQTEIAQTEELDLLKIFEELMDILLRYFPADSLKIAIKRVGRPGYFYTPNRFVNYLSQML